MDLLICLLPPLECRFTAVQPRPVYMLLRTESWASCMLGKHSTFSTTSSALSFLLMTFALMLQQPFYSINTSHEEFPHRKCKGRQRSLSSHEILGKILLQMLQSLLVILSLRIGCSSFKLSLHIFF